MAQSVEDEEDEVNLQYFCHVCDTIVSNIDYMDDGTIKCHVCNGMYFLQIIPNNPPYIKSNYHRTIR